MWIVKNIAFFCFTGRVQEGILIVMKAAGLEMSWRQDRHGMEIGF